MPTAISLLLLAACGGAPPPVTALPAPIEPPPAPAPLRSEGTIERAELDAVLEQGLGRFLQYVSTEPHLEDGRFVGFRFRELRGAFFAGIDLAPGDTLLSVNGAPIERPEQALRVWNELRVASELTLDVLHEGQQRRLRFEIVEGR